jgi:hypothetical protein
LFEVDITEYAKSVRENAVASNSIRIFVDDPHGGGKQIVMPKDEFDRRYPLDLVKMAYWRREPDDPDKLKAVIDNVWNTQRESIHKSCDLWTHTSKLYDNRTEFYSSQIMESLNKLPEPNSPDMQFFSAPLNSYIAAAFNPEQLSRLLDAIPYKNAEFSIKKGQSGMNVLVPRDEILTERWKEKGGLTINLNGKEIPVSSPAKEIEKPSLLATLEASEQKSKQQFGQKSEQDKETPKKSKREEL